MRAAPAERLDGDDHLAREHQPRDEGEAQRSQQQNAGALDSGVERSVGLGLRQLDENDPSQRGDVGIGSQHAPALDILRLLELLSRIAAAAATGRTGRLDLRQTGEIGVAQH